MLSCVTKRKNITRRNEKISPNTTDITAAEQAESIFWGEKTVITAKRETVRTLCSNIWQKAGNMFICFPRKYPFIQLPQAINGRQKLRSLSKFPARMSFMKCSAAMPE